MDTGSFADRPIVMVALLAGLSLLPFLLVMMTSFVKIAVVLSILRNAIGSPPSSITVTPLPASTVPINVAATPSSALNLPIFTHNSGGAVKASS